MATNAAGNSAPARISAINQQDRKGPSEAAGKEKPTVIVVGAPPDEESLLRHQIADLVEVCGSGVDARAGATLFRERKPKIAVLYLDGEPEAILALSSEIARTGGCETVVVSRLRDPEQIRSAMRAGARDFAYLDAKEEDVRRAVSSLRGPTAAAQPAKSGHVTAVFACKGGSGATTIATNLAGALLPDGKNSDGGAVLLDLDFQMGDALVFLDLASRYTWRDLVANMHRLDGDLLARSLTVHSCGLRVIAQADQIDDADEIDGKGVTEGIRFLRRHFDHLVIDGLRDFSECALVALDAADVVLLTMTQDIPALKNANRCLKVFRRLGYSEDKVKLVVNRYSKRGDLDVDAISDALKTPVHATVANDFPTVVQAVNEGTLMLKSAPRAHVTRDVQRLRELVQDDQPKQKRGFLSRWSRR